MAAYTKRANLRRRLALVSLPGEAIVKRRVKKMRDRVCPQIGRH